LLRLNLFTYRDHYDWLAKALKTPPPEQLGGGVKARSLGGAALFNA